MSVIHTVTVPCPRCDEPLQLQPAVTAVVGGPGDRDRRRRGRFLVTVPVVIHRCPDLDHDDDDGEVA